MSAIVSYGEIRSTFQNIRKDQRVFTKQRCRAVTLVNQGDFEIEVTSEGGIITLLPTESIVLGGHEDYVRIEDLDVKFTIVFIPPPPLLPPVNPKRLLTVIQDIILKSPQLMQV